LLSTAAQTDFVDERCVAGQWDQLREKRVRWYPSCALANLLIYYCTYRRLRLREPITKRRRDERRKTKREEKREEKRRASDGPRNEKSEERGWGNPFFATGTKDFRPA
jgi:hypothetical protein